MNEVKPYQSEKDRVFATGKSVFIEDDKVETGKILRVTHISGTFFGIANSEYVGLGYWNGHTYVPLHNAKPTTANGWVHWNGNLWLREGQHVYAYLVNVADGEKMKLRVHGRWE